MINQPRIPLTARDFHLILYEALRPGGYLEQQFGTDITKFRDHEIGMMFVELLAGIGDIYSQAVGMEGREGNILTARETQSVIDAAAALGYTALLPKSSTLAIRITFNNYTGQLILPDGFRIGSFSTAGDQVVFELPQPVQKLDSVQTIDVTFTQGETVREDQVISSGNIRDRIELTDGPVSRDSTTVLVDGAAWSEVRNFVDSSPTSEHFRIIISEHVPGERRYLVEFGDGVRGKYPPPGSSIQISYRKGGGTDGNVPADVIGEVLDSVIAPDGSFVSVSVEALGDGAGGIDEETIDEIRVNSILEFFTNGRNVADDDYKTSAIVDGGLKRAIVLTSNQDATIPENMVLILGTLSIDTALTTSEADAALAAMLAARPKGGTTRVVVGPCGFESFTVSVEVRAYDTASLVDVDAETKLIVENLLSLEGMLGVEENRPRYILDVGKKIHPNTIEKEISKIPGVKYARLKFDGSDDPFTPESRNLPTPSTITYDIALED